MSQEGLSNNRRFVLLSGAQLLTSFGTWLMYLAVVVLIGVHWHRGPMAVALGMVSLVLPALVVGPLAGGVVDRYNRRNIMILSNILSAVAAGSLMIVQNLWQLYVALAVLGAVDAFFSPAESGMVKEVVADAAMHRAMSLRMMIAQGTKIIGPSLSGVLVASFGARIPFVIGAGGFAISAVIVSYVHGGKIPSVNAPSRKDSDSWAMRYSEGFGFLWQHSTLRQIIGFFIVMMFMLQMIDSQVVILMRQVPSASRIVGLSMSASGVGMVMAAVVVGRMMIRRTLLWVASGSAGMGMGFAGMAWLMKDGLPWGVPLAVLLTGAAAAIAMIPFNTTLQQAVPGDWTGRVMAAVGSLSSAAVVAGPLLGGILVKDWGPIRVFLVVGFLLMLLGMVAALREQASRRKSDVPYEVVGESARRPPPE